MSKRSVILLIEDMLEAIDKIERYTGAMSLHKFLEDEKTLDAVVRNLEVIGEASNRVPLENRNQVSTIEWRKIVGLRNRIVHEYFGIDSMLIWQIIQNDLPNLQSALLDYKSKME